MLDDESDAHGGGNRPGPRGPRGLGPHNFEELILLVLSSTLGRLGDTAPLYTELKKELGRIKLGNFLPLGDKQFLDQLRGNVPFNPKLPVFLNKKVPLDDLGISWDPAITSTEDFKTALRRNAPSLPSGTAEELRAELDSWAMSSPVTVFSVRRARKFGIDRLERLAPGPHILNYRLRAEGSAAAYLLLLEHDERRREWQCLSAMQGVGFPPEHKVQASTGQFEVTVSSAPGVCTVFVVGGSKPFDYRIRHLMERLRTDMSAGKRGDGTLDDQMTKQLFDLIRAERNTSGVGKTRYVGWFRYEVH